MIAERVGITHAGILHHFGSKEGVLRALLEREGPVPHFSEQVLHCISILDAALELLAEQGFILTSLPMIAERVGITHAGTLHHFGSIGGMLC